NVFREAGDEKLSTWATLVSVSPYIDPSTKTFKVKVRLDGDVSLFRPGMMVSVEIIYNEEDVLSLPQSIKKLDGSVYIVTKNEEGIDVAKYLELPTILEDDDFFQVEEKYRDVNFIYRGQTMVLDGEPVSVTEGY
ncbi:MAG: hypothetical protein ACI4SI_02865, partial [Candidatus Ornithospirochaeta sp.]